MGTDSILKAQEHVLKLIHKADSPHDAENIHALCHSLETLMQIEHMTMALRGVAIKEEGEFDFPNELD